MPTPTLITDLSTTAASNFPASSDSPSVLDDVQRAHAAFIAQIRDVVPVSSGGNLTFTGTGNRIKGDFSNATLANRVMFQSSTVNGGTVVGVIPNGTATSGQLRLYGNSDPTNASYLDLLTAGTADSRIEAGKEGTGTYLPMTFYTGGSERLRIGTAGNILVTSSAGLGYGTGSGGTVTQATSKSTAVTLNKPTGQITMNGAALATGAWVTFTLNNSLLSATDAVVASIFSDSVSSFLYSVMALPKAGAAFISIKQDSGASRSDAVVINFAIIKGATS